MVKLGDICTFQSGGTPSKSEPAYYNGNIPWITTVALNGSTINEKNAIEMITQKAISESAAKIVPAQSIMVGTRVGVGKVAVNSIPMSTSQDIISLLDIDEQKWDKHFLCKLILAKSEYLNSQARGATIKGIKIDTLSGLKLPELPIETQRKIALTIDKVSDLIALRKQQLAKLDKLVKARFVEMFGSIHDRKFEMKSLPEIVVKDKNSIKRGPFGGALKKEDFIEVGYLVYEQRHAIHNDFEYEKYYISKEKYEDMIGFKVTSGDLIISCSGVTLGRIAEVPKGAKEGIINQALLKLSLDQSVMRNAFFIHQFRSEEIQEILFGFSRGSGIPNMPSMNEVKAVKFICPPIELQNQFAALIEQTDKSKLEIQTALTKLETLKRALMQQYFGG